MSSFLNISRVPGFQFLNKQADVSDRPSQSSSPPTTVFGKQPLIPDFLLPYFTYLKAPNDIKNVKQPEFYHAKYKALQKIQIRENIVRIIEIGKGI